MRSRIFVSLFLLFSVLAVGTIATRGDNVAPARQWARVNFMNPTIVDGEMLMGPYLIVHDDTKMARGEPCTSFYRFNSARGPQEEAVSFHCRPTERKIVDKLTLTEGPTINGGSARILTEYQFAGDCEGHAIPIAH